MKRFSILITMAFCGTIAARADSLTLITNADAANLGTQQATYSWGNNSVEESFDGTTWSTAAQSGTILTASTLSSNELAVENVGASEVGLANTAASTFGDTVHLSFGQAVNAANVAVDVPLDNQGYLIMVASLDQGGNVLAFNEATLGPAWGNTGENVGIQFSNQAFGAYIDVYELDALNDAFTLGAITTYGPATTSGGTVTSASAADAPEPGTMTIASIGIIMLVLGSRRRSARKATR